MLEPSLSTTKRLSPTRITQSSQTLLDVAIASMPEKVIFSGVVHFGISDHSLIYTIRVRGIFCPTYVTTVFENA
jgi:hypothetical protein